VPNWFLEYMASTPLYQASSSGMEMRSSGGSASGPSLKMFLDAQSEEPAFVDEFVQHNRLDQQIVTNCDFSISLPVRPTVPWIMVVPAGATALLG